MGQCLAADFCRIIFRRGGRRRQDEELLLPDWIEPESCLTEGEIISSPHVPFYNANAYNSALLRRVKCLCQCESLQHFELAYSLKWENCDSGYASLRSGM